MGVHFLVPPSSAVTSIANANGPSIFISDPTGEYPQGITVTKQTETLSEILSRISITLNLTASTTQIFNGRSWLVNVYTDPTSGQQFLDAFTSNNNGVIYQIGGFENANVTSTLPGILDSFAF
jgi:hypothetical protein